MRYRSNATRMCAVKIGKKKFLISYWWLFDLEIIKIFYKIFIQPTIIITKAGISYVLSAMYYFKS